MVFTEFSHKADIPGHVSQQLIRSNTNAIVKTATVLAKDITTDQLIPILEVLKTLIHTRELILENSDDIPF